MNAERVMIDIKVNHAQRSGYFVRCHGLKQSIEKIESLQDTRVVGLVYDGGNSIELILDPPLIKLGEGEE